MGRVVVVGSVNMDVITRTDRIPRPGETVPGHDVHFSPGGKGANQAVAARRAGAATQLVAATGSDGFGAALRSFLTAEALDLRHLATLDGPSGTALTIVDQAGENVIVVVPGTNAALTPEAVRSVPLGPDDVVLLQDEIAPATNAAAVQHARAAGARTILNLAPYRETDPDLLAALDLLVVNETEFAALVPRLDTGAALSRPALSGPALLTAVRDLLSDGAGPTEDLVVTLGPAGICARVEGSVVTLAARHVPVVDTTGAGDCFCGTLGAGLAVGQPVATALFRANVAASLAVQRLGAAPAMPLGAEVDALLAGPS